MSNRLLYMKSGSHWDAREFIAYVRLKVRMCETARRARDKVMVVLDDEFFARSAEPYQNFCFVLIDGQIRVVHTPDMTVFP